MEQRRLSDEGSAFVTNKRYSLFVGRFTHFERSKEQQFLRKKQSKLNEREYQSTKRLGYLSLPAILASCQVAQVRVPIDKLE